MFVISCASNKSNAVQALDRVDDLAINSKRNLYFGEGWQIVWIDTKNSKKG